MQPQLEQRKFKRLLTKREVNGIYKRLKVKLSSRIIKEPQNGSMIKKIKSKLMSSNVLETGLSKKLNAQIKSKKHSEISYLEGESVKFYTKLDVYGLFLL